MRWITTAPRFELPPLQANLEHCHNSLTSVELMENYSMSSCGIIERRRDGRGGIIVWSESPCIGPAQLYEYRRHKCILSSYITVFVRRMLRLNVCTNQTLLRIVSEAAAKISGTTSLRCEHEHGCNSGVQRQKVPNHNSATFPDQGQSRALRLPCPSCHTPPY